jgi:hypothetical protein
MEFEPHLFERGLTFIETMDVWAPQKISLNRCKLLLTSDIRVSTRFNVDVGIWA